MTIVYFIIALGLLIFIHELGHFLVAKKKGIGVLKFSLGFGPKLIGFTRGETTYLISALPFGGYVKLQGEDPEEGDPNDPKNYSGRPIRHKFGVVFAGPFMNLLLAFVLMPAVFMIGRSEPAWWRGAPVAIGVKSDSPAASAGVQKGDRILSLDGEKIATWRDLLNESILKPSETVPIQFERGGEIFSGTVTLEQDPNTKGGYLGVEPPYFIGNEAIVDGVIAGSAAEQAGLQAGDTIVGINGEKVEGWIEMTDTINALGGASMELTVRGGEGVQTVNLIPRYDEEAKRWLIGIRKDFEKRQGEMVIQKYPFFEAVRLGFEENLRLAGMTFSILGRLLTFQLSYKTLGGPIRIAQASGAAAESGLPNFLYFLAFLSFQLGILNFLPIPILDGGHILFMGIEAVFRRPVSTKVRMIADQAGMALLLTLMVLVTLHDVDSVWGFGKIGDWVKGLF